MLALLADGIDGEDACGLMDIVIQLDPTVQDKRRALEALLALLAYETAGWTADQISRWVVQLGPTTQDKRQVRKELLRVLPLVAYEIEDPTAEWLARAVVQLDPTAMMSVGPRHCSGCRRAKSTTRWPNYWCAWWSGVPRRLRISGRPWTPRSPDGHAHGVAEELVISEVVGLAATAVGKRQALGYCSGCWTATPMAGWPKSW